MGNNFPFGFQFSEIKLIEMYDNVGIDDEKNEISRCNNKASDLNQKIKKILDLSNKLSWSGKAIKYEINKIPELKRIDPDDLEDTEVYCKVTLLKRAHE